MISNLQIWWSFTSTTSHLEVLQSDQFLGQSGKRTLFAIEALTAVDISRYSAVSGEKEFILPPSSSFKVVSKLCVGNDCWLVQLKQDDYIPLIGSAQQKKTQSIPTSKFSNNAHSEQWNEKAKQEESKESEKKKKCVHKLTKHGNLASWSCSECEKVFFKGYFSWMCSKCPIKLCGNCAIKAMKSMKKEDWN